MKTVLLPGLPIAQKRPRIFAKGGAMDPCWEAKEQHKHYIRDNYPSVGFYTEAITLELFFVYAYPKTMPAKKRTCQFKPTRPDVDNLCKYILDMGNGVLWNDDAIVTRLHTAKVFHENGPFTLICISENDNIFSIAETIRLDGL